MKTAKFVLEELTCPTCINKIEGVLARQKGVDKVKVLFNSSKVDVKFNAEEITTEELAELIRKTGYPVLSVKEK